MFKKSQLEVLIEDAEVALMALDNVTSSHDIDYVVQQTDRLIANAKLVGLNKTDGQVLANFGMLEQDYVDALTEMRDYHKGEALAVESDEGGLISKLLLAVIAAVGLLLAYIVGKIIGFLVGKVGDSSSDTPTAKITKELKDKVPDEHKDHAVKIGIEAIQNLIELTPKEILPPKTIAKYPYFKFSKKAAGEPDWLVDILAEATKMQGHLTKYTDDVNASDDEVKELLEDLKTNPRKDIGPFVDISVVWLEDLFGKLKLNPVYSSLSTQMQIIKSYKELKDYVWVDHGTLPNLKLTNHYVFNDDFAKKLKSDANKAKAANDNLAKNVGRIKTPSRQGKAAAAAMLNLGIKDPLDFSTRVLSKVVINTILKRLAWAALLSRIISRHGDIAGNIIKEAVKLEGFSTVKDLVGCIKLINEKGGVIAPSLKAYEAQLRPAPKDFESYASNVTEVII